MKKFNYVLLLIIFFSSINSLRSFAQSMGINEDGSAPHSSAVLHVKSSTKGFLMPVMSSSLRAGISSPADGLQVYDTDTKSFWYYKSGTGWSELPTGSSSPWSRASSFVYLNNATDQVGIGTPTPDAKLGVLQTGTVNAAEFTISNVSSTAHAVYTSTNGAGNSLQAFNSGTGRAGFFHVSSASNNSNALESITSGSGSAGNFTITNSSNVDYAVEATTSGTGYAGGFFGGIYLRGNGSTSATNALNVENSVGTNLLRLNNAGDLNVNGYTKLGNSASTPAVRMIKLTGTTASTQGGSVTIAHGLNAAKILSVSVLVDYCNCNAYVPAGYNANPSYEFDYYFDTTHVYVLNKSANSGSLISRPIKILITYEQ